jgi:threonine/homoserine/homoserine lactone efflux protein
VRKSPSLHGQKSTLTPKFLVTAEAFFVCHIDPNFQISLIYAFIGLSVVLVLFDVFSDVGFSKHRRRNCHKAITLCFFGKQRRVGAF